MYVHNSWAATVIIKWFVILNKNKMDVEEFPLTLFGSLEGQSVHVKTLWVRAYTGTS